MRKQNTTSIITIILAALFSAAALLAEPPRFLLTADADILAQIPPPPADDSPAGMADIETLLQVQQYRTPAEIARAERVSSQDIMSPGAFVFGPEFNAQNLPRTAAVLQQAYDEHRPSVLASKKQWGRARPYNRGLGITPCVEIVPKDESYPSGHSAESALLAALYGKALPEYENIFMENVRETLWGRVIAGVHFPTDTQAGRLIGSVIAREMLKNPCALGAFDEMRAEILSFMQKHPAAATAANVRSADVTAKQLSRRPLTRAARLHSHNDYRQQRPFFLAYSQMADTIEADIWSTPVPGELRVAHDKNELPSAPTLDEAYLHPLVEVFRQNGGRPWKDSEKHLILMVDFKTPDAETLGRLAAKLKKYPDVFDTSVNPRAVRVVITNSDPLVGHFGDYPGLLSYDGSHGDYTPAQLEHIHMISYRFRKLSHWTGKGRMSDEARARLVKAIDDAHALGKPVRFWGAPDNEIAWEFLLKLGVDYINTDKPESCAAWLRK